MLLPLLLVVAGAVGGQDTGGPYTGTIAVHTGADTQVLYCTVLHCTVLHTTVLQCTVLHSTVLYYTVSPFRAPALTTEDSLSRRADCSSRAQTSAR